MSGNGKAVLGVILVFVLGCLSGILGASVYFNHRDALFFERGPAAYIDMLQNRLTRQLDLDAAQKEQIHRYFMENLERRKQLQSRLQPEMRTFNIQMVREIESVLRPDQLSLFHKNLLEVHRHPNQWAPNNPAPGQPAPGAPGDGSKIPEN